MVQKGLPILLGMIYLSIRFELNRLCVPWLSIGWKKDKPNTGIKKAISKSIPVHTYYHQKGKNIIKK
jgi:hypothetical protein